MIKFIDMDNLDLQKKSSDRGLKAPEESNKQEVHKEIRRRLTTLLLDVLKKILPEKKKIKESKETYPPKRINFFDQNIEIIHKERYKHNLRIATQRLLLKFAERKSKAELNEIFWERAICKVFRNVLRDCYLYKDVVEQFASELNVPKDVIYVFMVESGFDPTRASPSGCVGIAQLSKSAIIDVRGKYLFSDINLSDKNKYYDPAQNPIANLKYGTAYLKKIHDEEILGSTHVWLEKRKNWLFEAYGKEEKHLSFAEKILGLEKFTEQVEKKKGRVKKRRVVKSNRERFNAILNKLTEHNYKVKRWSFAVAAYNTGPKNLVKILYQNLLLGRIKEQKGEELNYTDLDLEVKIDGEKESNDIFYPDFAEEVSAFDADIGIKIGKKESQIALDEKKYYVWEALIAKELFESFDKLEFGKKMEVSLPTLHGDKKFEIEKIEGRYLENQYEEVIVPFNTDLYRLAEELAIPYEGFHKLCSPELRLAFVPDSSNLPQWMKDRGGFPVLIPKNKINRFEKVKFSKNWTCRTYKVRRGDTGSRIIEELKKRYKDKPEIMNKLNDKSFVEAIFWEYNRIKSPGMNPRLREGEIIYLPSILR